MGEVLSIRRELAAVVVGMGRYSPTARTLFKAAEEIDRTLTYLEMDLPIPAHLQIECASDRLARVAVRFWIRPWTQERVNEAAAQADEILYQIRRLVYDASQE